MSASISLLGPPRIETGGVAVPSPRGAKSWALLAYLVLAPAPVPRSRIAELLFPDAEDPQGALRWTLSQLRRSLSGIATLEGDPVRLDLTADAVVDAHVVSTGTWAEALALPGFGSALLDGVTVRVGPAFELWLSAERRRLAGNAQAMLQEAANSRLARGDEAAAAELATRAIALDPLDEPAHELLVRILVLSGRDDEALRQVEQFTALLRREVGADPSPSLAAALRYRPVAASSHTRGAVRADVETGLAAFRAGAYDRGVQLLRSAVASARVLGDRALLASALAGLGTALVHGVRGRDGEAMTLLHEAFAVAEAAGVHDVAAQAAHELGHIETLHGNYPRMEYWLGTAARLAGGNGRLLAWIDVYAGFGRTDQGDYAAGEETLRAADRGARRAGDARAIAYANAGLGRLHLLRGELERARTELDVACDATMDVGWTSFLSYPQALRAEVSLREGRLDDAADAFEHAYALACQVGDPCWESYSLRGRGLLAAELGDDEAALDMLTQARSACSRMVGTHDWVQGYSLDALCGFTIERGFRGASAWVDELEEFSSRRGMRELVARSALHRASLGQEGAAAAAAVLVGAIDNPVLHALLEKLQVKMS